MQPIQYPHYKIALHELQHQAVRDLAWCCFSAPMMQELPGSPISILPFHNQFPWHWLQALDQQPEPLLDHLSQRKSTRLGIYYEALWHFYFANYPEWELLQHNLQIDRNGITLGAFDFLCRRNEEYWHIETAVKFYLCSAGNPLEAYDWKYWIGPDSKDRLDLKLNHLRQHQLPLHHQPEAQLQLRSLYPDAKEWNTGLCIQGYLFSPAQRNSKPAFVHSHHERGSWWRLSQFLQEISTQSTQPTQSTQRWLILERQQWLSPAHCTDVATLFSSEQLAEKLFDEVHGAQRPQLIAAMKLEESSNNNENQPTHSLCWIESERIFVVPDEWPDYSSVRPGKDSPARNT
ncbi:MAG: hypothetical protein B0W54_02670 [Cellvibrio sp. 79]|nr:MAG: hypothetical protein B0W54_02670 [Cellvibrio sp. 79]